MESAIDSSCTRQREVPSTYSTDTLNLLRSGRAITSQEARILESNMLKAKAEVESCDQELTRLEARIAALRERRTDLEAGVRNANALLAPIRRLPPELVARICAFSLPHGWFTDCVTRRGPWKVLQLCHAWREVALSMHHCWAEFTLAELKKIMETDKAVDIVTTHLQRSASLPLAVRIWPPADTRIQFRPDLKLFEVLEALKPELHRIRVLHLRCGHGAALPESLPMVEEIALGPFDRENGFLTVIPSNATHLRALDLVDWRMTNVACPWASLRSLSITHYNHVQYFNGTLEALQQCTGLETFALAVKYPNTTVDHTDFLWSKFRNRPTVTLPSLHTLIARDLAIYCVRWLLAPNLRTAELDAVYKYEEGFGSGDYNIREVGSDLRALLRPVSTLKLRLAMPQQQDPIDDILQAPECLRSLHIRETVSGYFIRTWPPIFRHSLLQSLVYNPKEYKKRLPHLTELVLTNTDGCEKARTKLQFGLQEAELICQVVESQLEADEGRSKIERLVVHCPNIECPRMFKAWITNLRKEGALKIDVDFDPRETKFSQW
ncbi:hypothetical protein EV122DRAFT_280571 [Schizophyllum commune]